MLAKLILSFKFSNQKVVCISQLPHAYYMHKPYYGACFIHANDIWCVQNAKSPIMKFSSLQLLSLRLKYSP